MLALALGLLAGRGEASSQRVFSDHQTFVAITDGVEVSGPLGDCMSLSCGAIRFSAGVIAHWTSLLPGFELAITGVDDLDIELDEPAYGIGFNLAEPSDDPQCLEPCIDSTFEITLRSGGPGGAQVGQTVAVSPPNDVAAFVGIATTETFDRVEIREIVGGGENEYFGRVWAAHAPLRPETQVNSYTTAAQLAPAVAHGLDGSFVVVWQSDGSPGSDDDGYSIQAQRFGSDALPLGEQLQVTSSTLGWQIAPDVAVGPAGDFVVVWRNTSSGPLSGGRLFTAAGAPFGSQLAIGEDPSVAMAMDGSMVVAWKSAGDGSGNSIHARRFASDGSTVGAAFLVNSYTTGGQSHPALAFTSGGDFVIAWESTGSFSGDTSLHSVQAQRFTADGSPLSFEFQVNVYTTHHQWRPDVAAEPDGGFVIAWETDSSLSTPGPSQRHGIRAQRFTSNAQRLGSEIAATPLDTTDRSQPVVTVDPSGDLFFAWEQGVAAPDIHGLRLPPDSFLGGPDIEISTTWTGSQRRPAISADSRGELVVVWSSAASSGSDSSSYSIQAQRLPGPFIFADGWESGDAARWSSSLP